MAFSELTATEAAVLAAYQTSRRARDRSQIVVLAARRDIEQIDEAAAFILSAPALRDFPADDLAVIEAGFAVPRAAALAMIADARTDRDGLDATIDELRSFLLGGDDG